MPTYDRTDTFRKDFAALGELDRDRFRRAVAEFIDDLKAKRGFRPGLRVKGVQGTRGVNEMTWARDGRATFEYGDELLPGEPRIVWRRIGTHDIFGRP